jgi:hypothetical protein
VSLNESIALYEPPPTRTVQLFMPTKRPRSPAPAPDKNDVDALLIGVSKRLRAIFGTEGDETHAPDLPGPSPVPQPNPGVEEPHSSEVRTVGSRRLTPEQIAQTLDQRFTSEQKSILKLLALYFALGSTGRIPTGTIDFGPLCRSLIAAVRYIIPYIFMKWLMLPRIAQPSQSSCYH